MTPPIVVVAGIIERHGRVLLTRRLAGTHLSGLWEFPGGKIEPGEALAVGLARELMEELGVVATVGHQVLVTDHTYADRVVRLHFFRCGIAGTPEARLGQQMRWATRAQLRTLDFPDADHALIEILTAPTSPGRNSP